MIICALAFFVTAFEAGAVEGGGVRRLVGAEQVNGDGEVEVDVALNGGQINHTGGAQFGDVVGFELVHDIHRALNRAADTRFAHKHVMRFFGQHELGGARQRIEGRFGQSTQLEFAVTVGEVSEHEKRQPVRGLLVEGLQDTGVVFVAAVTLQQSIGFFTAIFAEILVQQVNHGPQVTAFFHIDLEQVAKVVHAGGCEAQMTLLLDRCWLGVALGHDDAAQVGAVFARDILPSFFTNVVAKMNLALLITRIQKHAPSVVAHFDVAKLCPTLWINAHCGTQVHVHVLRAFGAHFVPPVNKVGLPLFKRTLQRTVFRQVNVIRNFFAVVDTGHECLQKLKQRWDQIWVAAKTTGNPAAQHFQKTFWTFKA